MQCSLFRCAKGSNPFLHGTSVWPFSNKAQRYVSKSKAVHSSGEKVRGLMWVCVCVRVFFSFFNQRNCLNNVLELPFSSTCQDPEYRSWSQFKWSGWFHIRCSFSYTDWAPEPLKWPVPIMITIRKAEQTEFHRFAQWLINIQQQSQNHSDTIIHVTDSVGNYCLWSLCYK